MSRGVDILPVVGKHQTTSSEGCHASVVTVGIDHRFNQRTQVVEARVTVPVHQKAHGWRSSTAVVGLVRPPTAEVGFNLHAEKQGIGDRSEVVCGKGKGGAGARSHGEWIGL